MPLMIGVDHGMPASAHDKPAIERKGGSAGD